MSEPLVRARVVVSGRVQGVWFRQSTAERARTEGVSGWVRNLTGGSVEAAFEGPADAVDRMVAHVRVGPPRADVVSCDVTWEKPAGERGFAIRG